ncbi:hypothetical protein [cf. Phormidesmis sp. LEGE 11477]|uniref:hypothetical protein n=1 Tax=cf. Phormidesmis sp. LEGE 11477 TaxID=1828680 RepID=UPI0018814E5B|nr:hypothetical protein [cf. Phormidesmis sp. LEGE 11477]MBE9060300.1 hypothetical protein [cf. Phormidesmis sp. LEGE 11477]
MKFSCEETEFGQAATLTTSAEPSSFFVARYLSGCTPGELGAGTEIGTTLGPLGWEQHNQMNDAAKEPIRISLSGHCLVIQESTPPLLLRAIYILMRLQRLSDLSLRSRWNERKSPQC